jgi:hypothetical protein
MQQMPSLPTLNYYPKQAASLRSFALWYFSLLITVWTILGHTVLGFEQSWAQPFVALTVSCAVQLALEWIDARARGREPRYKGGINRLATVLLPAWISGMAVGMLLFCDDELAPVAFASALAIASKVLFRAPIGATTQHFYNPSNFGCAATLVLLPWVTIAPPYHFTENAIGLWNWLIPGVILISGLALHAKTTGRLPLIAAWLGGFAAQGFARHLLFGLPLAAQLGPMTSAAFALFTLYMIPDPATSPIQLKGQLAFGFSIAVVYGLLLVLHIPYGLFFSLTIVATARGLGLFLLSWLARTRHNAA